MVQAATFFYKVVVLAVREPDFVNLARFDVANCAAIRYRSSGPPREPISLPTNCISFARHHRQIVKITSSFSFSSLSLVFSFISFLSFFFEPYKWSPLAPDVSQPFISQSFATTSDCGEEKKKGAAVSILKGQIQIAPLYNLARQLGRSSYNVAFLSMHRIAS